VIRAPRASVVVTRFERGGVDVHAFVSLKEAVQYFLADSALAGAWGSDEHLAALEETATMLSHTIETGKRVRAEEHGHG
jgi:hypothetical protein